MNIASGNARVGAQIADGKDMNVASGNARVGTQIGGIGKTRSYATCPACGQAAPVNVEITDDDMQVTCSNCGNPRN